MYKKSGIRLFAGVAAAVFAATFLLLFMLHEQKQINGNRREHHKKSDKPPPAEPYSPTVRQIMYNNLRTPLKKCGLTADDGASSPAEWCSYSGEMVHGGRR